MVIRNSFCGDWSCSAIWEVKCRNWLMRGKEKRVAVQNTKGGLVVVVGEDAVRG